MRERGAVQFLRRCTRCAGIDSPPRWCKSREISLFGHDLGHDHPEAGSEARNGEAELSETGGEA